MGSDLYAIDRGKLAGLFRQLPLTSRYTVGVKLLCVCILLTDNNNRHCADGNEAATLVFASASSEEEPNDDDDDQDFG
jgi:hypothetical protein